MGLDMYLYAKKYVEKMDWEATHKHSDENPTERSKYFFKPEFNNVLEAAGLVGVPADDIYGATVEVVAGYWRKANAIHGWFVNNVQNGEDDCGTYYVSRDKLIELKELCRQVLETGATDLLPPVSGFFFGSTDTDDWYLDSLRNTIDIVDHALSLSKEISFEYHSSW